MTIEEMKSIKRELGLTNQTLSDLSGVPLGTIQKIFGGATKAPRKETIDAIVLALSEKAHGRTVKYEISGKDYYVRERALDYYLDDVEQGEYTLDDYYALPDEKRVELIDGVFYDMASPSKIHQGILGGLFVQLDQYVQNYVGKCFLYAAPSDVELGEDRKTVVQPDIYIHCDPEKEVDRPHHGSPDFIVEILSPSSRSHDLWRKQELYRRHGVREYWIVDPKNKSVVVYHLTEPELPRTYTFEDEVPVGISEGECTVEFKKVYQRVQHFYEA